MDDTSSDHTHRSQHLSATALPDLRQLLVQDEAPEWALVQRVVADSVEKEADAWSMLARCARLEAFTDGSAPILNPGGPAGFSAVLIGWLANANSAEPDVVPSVRVDLAGYIPPRRSEPPTSNNRAEIAGILASLAAAGALPPGLRRLTVWSDSDYAVNCATGRYRRKKNLDLWAAYDALFQQVEVQLPRDRFELLWLKGHAGNPWNEAADELATRAAFNFEGTRYQRYRMAQQTTGREMPHVPGLTGKAETALAQPIDPDRSSPEAWLQGTDYTLVLDTHINGQGQASIGSGPASGRYQLWTRQGKGVREVIQHVGNRAADEAEYLTLIAALHDLLRRITAKGGDPGKFTLTVYSRQEVLVKQLAGEYRVRAAALQPQYTTARALLDRFAAAQLIWKPGSAIAHLLAPKV